MNRLAKFLYRKDGKINRSLVLLSISLSCGIAALVALETFSRRVEGTVSRDSKKNLAADYQIQSWRPFDEKVLKAIEAEKASGDTILLKDFISSLSYTLNGTLQTATVSVRAVEGDAYPFYGDFILKPQISIKDLREDEKTIVLDKGFEARGLKVGDSVQLGEISLRVKAFLIDESQNVAGAFTLGPRVIISMQTVEATGLLKTGSRVFHRLLVKSPLDSETFEKKFRAEAPDLHWRIITPERANRQVERVLDRMRGFLSFVGVASLFLGAIGLFMVFRSQFLRKLPSYLTLKCIGAKNDSIVQVALMSSLQVAILGSIIGIFLGLSFEGLLSYMANRFLEVDLGSVSWGPAFFWGISLSLLCVGVAVFIPLREVLRVPVAYAIRQDEAGMSTLSKLDAFVAFIVAVFIVFWVGPKFQMSVAMLAGIFLAVLLLVILGNLLLNLFTPFARGFILRHSHMQLIRKKGRTQLLVIAMGMSLFFLFLILLLGSSIRQQLARVNQKDIPNLFALNVSDESKDALTAVLPKAEYVPITQARIAQIKGKEVVEGEVPEEGAERFYQTREYVITKRDTLAAGEELQGTKTLFTAPRDGFVRVSLEERFANRLKIKIGEEFKLDIAGVTLNAVVTSFRKVNWFNFQPNFFMVLHPDDIAGAPMNYVALARVPSEQIASYQNRAAKEVPQVTLVDGEALASRLLKVLGQLSLAVYSVTIFSLTGSIFVFIGIFLARRNELTKELALWRCLGLRNKKILGIYVFESMFLGLLASLTAYTSALIVVAVICKWVIDIPIEFMSYRVTIVLLLLPALLSVLGVWALLRKSLSKNSQSLFRLAEETF